MIETENCLIINAELDIECENKNFLNSLNITRYYFKELVRLVKSYRLIYKKSNIYIILLRDIELYNKEELLKLDKISTLLIPNDGVLEKLNINIKNVLSGFDFISITGYLISEHKKQKNILKHAFTDGEIVIKEKFTIQVDSDVIFLKKLPKLKPLTIFSYFNDIDSKDEFFEPLKMGDILRTNTCFIYNDIDNNLYKKWYLKLKELKENNSKSIEILEFHSDKISEYFENLKTDYVLIGEEIAFDLTLLNKNFESTNIKDFVVESIDEEFNNVTIWRANTLGMDYLMPAEINEIIFENIYFYHDPFVPNNIDMLDLITIFKLGNYKNVRTTSKFYFSQQIKNLKNRKEL